MRNQFILFSLLTVLLISIAGIYWPPASWLFALFGPVILFGIYDMLQRRHSIRRNFPVLGYARYIMEDLRPKIYQYFIESELDGKPINRMYRSIAYQRAKRELDTTPFGTKVDIYEVGYEWMNHSVYALDHHTLDQDPRVTIGSKDCSQPYDASILNISAMSYGALSNNAVMALNAGAKIGGFAHNTGEGSISDWHLEHEGDLIWQIGTGYFGCRDKEGNFSEALFEKNARQPAVKMIEIKLSQGAKPGHGGILPAKKNTEEIAKIRNVEPGTQVVSPSAHTAFGNPQEMVAFIKKLRELSGGKPVGFKLCIGIKSEFISIVQAMKEAGTYADFIVIDGGEGGTGAAPLEFSNSVGMPLREGLAFAHDILMGYGLRKEIKLIASGKVFTGFHMVRLFALGADACYSARGMMLALGCIQALECNNNNCPTGITTQRKDLVAGLVVEDKKQRVANFHRETIESVVELLASSGLRSPAEVGRQHIHRRVSSSKIKRYDELYPEVAYDAFTRGEVPGYYKAYIKESECLLTD